MAVGTLAVNVVAKTMRARKDLKSFRREVDATGNTVEQRSRTFRRFGRSMRFATAGGAAAAAGMILLTKSFRGLNSAAADLDRTAKVARKLGVGTNELMGLRHAAEQTAGVTGGTLDMALQRMTRRVAEAAKGTGEAKNALKELGLDAGELNRLTPDQIFLRISSAMKGVQKDSDKVRLAFKLFDSEGVDLVNTLKEGPDALKKLSAEARRLHGDLSQGNIARVEKYNDAMGRLKKSFGSLGTGIVVRLGPGAAAFADKLSDALIGFRSFREGAADKILGPMSDGSAPAGEEAKPKARTPWSKLSYAQKQSILEQRRRKKARSDLFNKPIEGTFSAVGGAFKTFSRGIQDAKRRFEAFEREGFKRAAEGRNPLTGRKVLGKSDARRALEQPRNGSFRRDRVNTLVDANSREGYMALRANQRGGGDEVKQHAKKTADATTKTATAAERSATGIEQMLRLFGSVPPPASA